MSAPLFKQGDYSLSGLIDYIGLFYTQRPFVWANAKVRDLCDSMCLDYQKLLGEEN